MARILLLRHAESEANVRNVFANREPSPGLTARGRAQAEAFARRDLSFDAVYSSPLRRAVETARFVAEPTLHDGLREFDSGDWEGADCAAHDAEFSRVARAWMSGDDPTARPPGGEDLLQIGDRAGRFLGDVRHLGTVLAVTHGGLIRCLLLTNVLGTGAEVLKGLPLGHTQGVWIESVGEGWRMGQPVS